VSGTASFRANRTPLLSKGFEPADAVMSNVSVLLYSVIQPREPNIVVLSVTRPTKQLILKTSYF